MKSKIILLSALFLVPASYGATLTGTMLFNVGGPALLSGDSNDIYWNGFSCTTGGPTLKTASATLSGNNDHLTLNDGTVVTSSIAWNRNNTGGAGFWAALGTADTTPTTYCSALAGADSVRDTAYSFNNDSNHKFTFSGLEAGKVYTLSFGGNSGLTATAINYTFNDMVSGSLAGTGGTVTNNVFKVTNPNTTPYALEVQLTANEQGEISYSGTRASASSSSVNFTYYSLTGEFQVQDIPEPATSSLGLLGLSALLLRRRRI